MERDNARLLLTTLAQTLEMMKVTLEGQILMIRQELGRLEPPKDPSVLGYDTLGRAIKKRNISPEVRAQRVEFIKRARELKLARLRGEDPTAEKASTAPAGMSSGGKKK